MNKYSIFREGSCGEDEEWRRTMANLILNGTIAAVWNTDAGDFQLFALPHDDMGELEHQQCADQIEKALALEMYREGRGDEVAGLARHLGAQPSHYDRLSALQFLCLVGLVPPEKQRQFLAELEAMARKEAS